MITRRLVVALQERLRIGTPARKALTKIFPDHWTFLFGEIALYAFVLLVMTGVFLALFFEPSTAPRVYDGSFVPMQGRTASAAFVSAVSLSFDVRTGLLLRQAHHWAALVFIAAIVVHLLRIFFTGAYRKPREINWLVGVTMLMLALLNGFTGYSMPDDLLSGTGLRIAYAVVLSIPVVGSWLAFILFGGDFPAEQTIPRLFTAHVFLVPALLATLIAVHLTVIIRQKHSQFPGPGRTENNVAGSRMWPGYTARTLALFSAVAATVFALGGLVQINPVWIYGPFEPAQVTTPAQPDWFVAWEEGALRLFPPAEFHVFGYLVPSPFVPGVVLGAITFTLLYAWPFLEARFTHAAHRSHQLLDRPRDHPGRVAVGVAAVVFLVVLVVAAGDDIIARYLGIPVAHLVIILRALVLALPVAGGAIAYVLARGLRDGSAKELGDLSAIDIATVWRGKPRGSTDEQASSQIHLDVWQEGEQAWRWRYRQPDGLTLTSNDSAPTRQQAEQDARHAYPQGQTQLIAPITKEPDDEIPEPIHKLAVGAWVIGVGIAVVRSLRAKRRK